ncbi:hypothetical protein [Staphylococcus agnetis]|uniref:phage upper tail fiber protein n=1 Tax=Staphylococcus agnetis TaxID=985762 RepID=UPI0039EC13A1
MKNSSLRNKLSFVNNKNATYLQIKQGDLSPIVFNIDKFILAGKDNVEATLYLKSAKSKSVAFTKKYQVKSSTLAVIIDVVLPTGVYFVELDIEGRKYPSNDSIKLVINPSSAVAPSDLQDLLTTEKITKNIIEEALNKVDNEIRIAKKDVSVMYIKDVETKENVTTIFFSNGRTVEIPHGKDGLDGKSITIVNKVNDNGNIKLTFSDNTTILIPKGKDGENGVKGKDGESLKVQHIENQPNGDKKVYFNNGDSFTVPKGDVGKSLTIKKTTPHIDRVEIEFSDGTTTNIPFGTNGKNGESAYEIASKYGSYDSEEAWVASLKGEKGFRGLKGDKGSDGKDGKSISITSVDYETGDGNVKVTFSDDTSITIPKGKDGAKGEDGARGARGYRGKDGSTVTINQETGYWEIDGVQTEVKARVESLEKIELGNIDGLEERLQQLQRDAKSQVDGLKRKELAELTQKVESFEPKVKEENQAYVDKKIEELIDSAPENLNTLNELATALQENQSMSSSVVQQISSKASEDQLQQGLAKKAEKVHKHNTSEVTGLDEWFEEKKATITQEQSALLQKAKTEAGDLYATKQHSHDNKYAPLSHKHEINDVNGLEERLLQVSKGQIGKDGKSITIQSNITDSEGNIQLTFSDNTKITIPKGAKGEQGATGAEGAQGQKGEDGKSVSISKVEETTVTSGGGWWWSTSTSTKVMRITFSDGKTADIPFGKDGEKGETGANGKSAYDIAKENGFHGSVSEWLQSLKGKDGNDGAKGENGKDGTSVTIWTGTQSDYNSLDSKDFNTLYLIKG